MFTGLITAMGEVAEIVAAADGAQIRISAPPEWLRGAKIGDSIAADGACLTATDIAEDSFAAALSPETLARCATFRKNVAVNLEHPIAAGERFGGHFVSGHVEGIARAEKVDKTEDGGRRITFAPPPTLMQYIIPKGSVALCGVSLTVNAVGDSVFAAQIIPHTLAQTTLGRLQKGDAANLETDMLARHLHKLAGGVL